MIICSVPKNIGVITTMLEDTGNSGEYKSNFFVYKGRMDSYGLNCIPKKYMLKA